MQKSPFRIRVRALFVFALALFLLQWPSVTFAENTKVAFIAPDARSVSVGNWRNFFYPNAYLPLSYLPNVNAVTLEQRRIFGSVLPPCDGKQSACISEVHYQIGNGEWFKATPTSDQTQRDVYMGSMMPNGEWELLETKLFPEDVSKNLPQGDAARLWVFPQAPHGGGDAYQISAQLSGGYSSNGIYSPDVFNLQIIPQKRIYGVTSRDCPSTSMHYQTKRFDPVGLCVTNFDFPANINFRVKINLGSFLNSINGWFDSRIKELGIDIDKQQRSLTIEGKPLTVPTASSREIRYEELASLGLSQIPQSIQDAQTRANTGTAGAEQLNTPLALERFLKLGNNIFPKALGENTIWQVSSLTQTTDNAKCLDKGNVNGIVSTNATVYDSAAPKWNEEDSSLSFRVGAAHHKSNGEVFQGYYALTMNQATANCYWGNSFNNAKATVSVIGQAGEQNVSTSSFTTSNGWVNFIASGFTFSVPTIKVKYVAQREAAPVPAPTPTPVVTEAPPTIEVAAPVAVKKPNPIAARKITITCVKGKAVKKVTAVKPVCPKGYKKR
jgi:hypothetical protein